MNQTPSARALVTAALTFLRCAEEAVQLHQDRVLAAVVEPRTATFAVRKTRLPPPPLSLVVVVVIIIIIIIIIICARACACRRLSLVCLLRVEQMPPARTMATAAPTTLLSAEEVVQRRQEAVQATAVALAAIAFAVRKGSIF